MASRKSKFRAENDTLRKIVKDLHWQARRYCDGRSSYATKIFNDDVRELIKLGIELNPTADRTIWARDSMGRKYDGLTDIEASLGSKVAEYENIDRFNELKTMVVSGAKFLKENFEEAMGDENLAIAVLVNEDNVIVWGGNFFKYEIPKDKFVSKTTPDFNDVEIIESGNALKFGQYEATFGSCKRRVEEMNESKN